MLHHAAALLVMFAVAPRRKTMGTQPREEEGSGEERWGKGRGTDEGVANVGEGAGEVV